jgi:hypothetical protein
MPTAPRLFLLTALLPLLLSACKTPSAAPTKPPLPPRVDCLQAQTAEPQRPQEWTLEGLSVALASALGILTEERELRGREHECVARLRAEGLIR